MDAAVALTQIKAHGVVLWMHTVHDPSREEWAAGIDKMKALKEERGLANCRSLVLSDGGAPNATQRGELFDLFDGQPYKLVVVTIALTNPIKRGIATALSWINPSFRAVGPGQVGSALEHLDLGGQLPALLPELDRLQTQLPPNITLQKIKNALPK